MRYCLKFICVMFFIIPCCWAVSVRKFSTVNIVLGENAHELEKRAAELLCERMKERYEISVALVTGGQHEDIKEEDLFVLLGVPGHHRELDQILSNLRVKPLTWLDPGLEGFVLFYVPESIPVTIVIAGVDYRGCLYGVGEFLRRADDANGKIVVSTDLFVRTAPAFEWRGTQVGQSSTQIDRAGSRPLRREELERVILDYVLAGANTFEVVTIEDVEFLERWGLKKRICIPANAGDFYDHPEWAAKESIGRPSFVCLSVPEARQAVIEKCERFFREFPFVDIVHFSGGDGGGCECDKCDPYGRVFIETVAEMARRVKKYHPAAKIVFTNQKFDNDDDIAIFDYLNQNSHEWLYAWCLSPGGDGTTWQPGHRQTHRMDLFHYPGYGPYGLYPRYLLHVLPEDVELLCGSEITHWRYAQHAYIQKYPRADRNGDQPPPWSHEIYERRPDRFLTQVYDRRTFYAWPRYYARVFSDLMHYSVGDITHSSGLHDHFNQWMWMRLLWNPRQPVEKVVEDYCRTFFGAKAVPYMKNAIFLLEEYLEDKETRLLPEKTEIDEYIENCRRAGLVMSARQREKSWLWRVFLQKGLVDKWVQLAVMEQLRIQKSIEKLIECTLKENANLDTAIRHAQQLMKRSWKTREMESLLVEAKELAYESDQLFGFRNDALNYLDRDYIGLGWLRRQLERANKEPDIKKKYELLWMIPHYEDAGEGGFYDNLGTYNSCPHVVFGYPYDHGQPYLEEMLDEGNRYSQKEMHYTQDEAQGITLHYTGLDSQASYQVRFTFVRPWYQERYVSRMVQKTQSILADQVWLARNVELPFKMCDHFTFDIPKECTEDGELTISLVRDVPVEQWDRVTREQWRNTGGWGTLCSEVWLIKKAK